jgi:SpoVK/Ycf46/Vps4 family AAA+-type ATPase
MLTIRKILAKGKDLKSDSLKKEKVPMESFTEALQKVRPVSRGELSKYERIVKDFEYVR